MGFLNTIGKILNRAEVVFKNEQVKNALNPRHEKNRKAWGLSNIVLYSLVFVFLWVMILSLHQDAGFRKGLILAYGVFGFCYGIVMLWKVFFSKAVRATPWMIYILIGLGIFWFWVNGTHHLIIFIVAVIIGIMVAGITTNFFLRAWIEGKEQEDEEQESRVNVTINVLFLVIGLATWLAASSLMTIFKDAPCKLVEPSKSTSRQEWNGLSVGLCLSGGGYRAALMHAGVLMYLKEKKVPITHISAVSGGSIIGSFYAAGGDPEDFKKAVKNNRLNVLRDLWSPEKLLRMWAPLKLPFSEVRLFPWYEFSRIDVLASALDRVLLDGKTLKELSDPIYPRLQICTTDLRKGMSIGIAQAGVFLQPIRRFTEGEKKKEYFENALSELPLSRLVAASGAFPLAFDPVSVSFYDESQESPMKNDDYLVSTKSPKADQRGTNTVELLLGDGGLTDNLGVKLLLGRQKKLADWKIDILIVSDGGKHLEHDTKVSGVVDQISRAADIVYEGSGWNPLSQNSEEIQCGDGSKIVCKAITSGDEYDIPIVFLRPTEIDQKQKEIITFKQIGTLNPRIETEQVDALFRLGNMLVNEKWRQIESYLNCLAQQ